MKILFVLSEYLPESGGGIISYYAGILPRLAAAGHEIHVLVARSDRLDLPEVEIDGVHVRYLQSEFVRKAEPGFARFRAGYPTLSTFLPLAWAACEQVRHGEGFDLVETTDYSLLFAPWIVATDAPVVNISLHGSSGQLEWYERNETLTLDADLVRLIERAAFSSASAVQANSASNAKFWQELIRRDISILPPMFPPSDQPAGQPGKQEGGIVVGRLQKCKGPDTLCRALESVPEAHVLWIGKDVIDLETGSPMSRMLRRKYPSVFGTRLIHQSGVPHNEVMEKMAQASFLCVPSTWDVFNLTVVEAMSLGVPVICSIKAGASMLIRHGENGFLFDPANPVELAGLIRRVLSLSETDRATITAKARETITGELAPSRLLPQRIAYYQSLVSNPRQIPADAWLRTFLSPRTEKTDRTDILQAFTAKELFLAAGRQLARGIERRLAIRKADQ